MHTKEPSKAIFIPLLIPRSIPHTIQQPIRIAIACKRMPRVLSSSSLHSRSNLVSIRIYRRLEQDTGWEGLAPCSDPGWKWFFVLVVDLLMCR